ncbi:hypothetical protein Pint_28387 [Pistacia integerrima]|uniref:Uncharacterized protein n=1 Tax=Pistacia integerrima TaxID=434235 RepID=A0ACC0YR24_9ROSI|nr:hypothetical protein Pint_28387 [Pistacia integerrima]
MAADLQGHGGGQHDQGHRRVQLSGSSSSNSSSSEEIGSGGIRKKGMKDKIKMKPPGGIITTPGGHNVMREGRRQHHDKEGMVEMIKEKFPEQSQ